MGEFWVVKGEERERGLNSEAHIGLTRRHRSFSPNVHFLFLKIFSR